MPRGKAKKPSLKKTISSEPTVDETNYVQMAKREIVEIVPEDMPTVIRCTLKKVPKHNLPLDKYQTDLKLGRYDYSASNFDGYGRTKFQVCVSMLVDWEPLIQKYPKREIAKRCMKFLFGRPMIQKIGKKEKEVWPFGMIDEDPQWFNFVDKDGQKYISAIIMTDMKDCQFFHGEGFKFQLTKTECEL